MAVYLSTTVTVKDVDKFRDYAEKAQPLVAAHGGEALMTGMVSELLVGEAAHHFEAVFRFADVAAVHTWHRSPEYQALVPLRDAGADVVFKIVEKIETDG